MVYLLCPALLLLMSGCESEVFLSGQPEEGNSSDGKVRVEIFARANTYPLPLTKGLEDENTVGMTPWVLVFKGNDANATFIEAAQAFELAGKRYVILTRQPAGSNYRLLILANPQQFFYYGDAVTAYSFTPENFRLNMTPEVTTLSDICSRLLTEPLNAPSCTVIPYSGAGELIPMSYLLTVDKIDNTTKIENTDKSSLQLVRAVAKMVITNKAPNFELKGVTAVVNVPRQGLLHNLTGSIMDNTSNLTEYRNDAAYSAPLVTAEWTDEGQSTEKTPVYLYESSILSGSYMIIQGKYGGREYYYKMVIVDQLLQPVKILRNRAYTFTIVTVKGPGYDSVADAKASKASNTDIDFMILIDDSDSYEITANNDYYLGVSNSVFIVYADEMADHEAFRLVTDCKVNFPDARSVTDNAQEVAEGVFRLAYPADGKIPIVDNNVSPRITAVGVNVSAGLQWYEEGMKGPAPGYEDRKNAYITLKLGNLEKQVHIRQRNAIPAAGMTLRYMPTNNMNPEIGEINYYCLSAYVEDGTDNPKNWIKLRPSIPDSDRNDTDRITVDDGVIYMEILPNGGSARKGLVYLTTIGEHGSSANGNATRRIKIEITQSGIASN